VKGAGNLDSTIGGPGSAGFIETSRETAVGKAR
jgi:hypothetical protein